MEDFGYEYDSGKSLISDFSASVVFFVISIIISVVSMIVTFLSTNDPEIISMTFAICSCIIFVTTIAVAIEGIKKKIKEEKQVTSLESSQSVTKPSSSFLFILLTNEDGEYKNNTCVICDDLIGADHHLAQCPVCGSLFHLNHFNEFVSKIDECPVCHFLLKK